MTAGSTAAENEDEGGDSLLNADVVADIALTDGDAQGGDAQGGDITVGLIADNAIGGGGEGGRATVIQNVGAIIHEVTVGAAECGDGLNAGIDAYLDVDADIAVDANLVADIGTNVDIAADVAADGGGGGT
jgi:hypothetical protein